LRSLSSFLRSPSSFLQCVSLPPGKRARCVQMIKSFHLFRHRPLFRQSSNLKIYSLGVSS
jgi:hypothetical protein